MMSGSNGILKEMPEGERIEERKNCSRKSDYNERLSAQCLNSFVIESLLRTLDMS